MEIKDFFQRWYQGMMSLPPTMQLKIRIILQIGITISYFGGGIFLFFTKYWYLGIVMLMFVGQGIMEYISVRQQLENLKNISNLMVNIDETKM